MKIIFAIIFIFYNFFFKGNVFSQSHVSNRMIYFDSSYYRLELHFSDFTFELYAAPNKGFEDFNRVNRGHFNIVNDKIYFHSSISSICYDDSSTINFICKNIDFGVYRYKGFHRDSILIYLDYRSDNVKIVRNLKDTFELDSGMNLIPFNKGDSLYVLHYLYFTKIHNLSDRTAFIQLYPFRNLFYYNYLDFPIRGVFKENTIIVDFDVQSNVVLRTK